MSKCMTDPNLRVLLKPLQNHHQAGLVIDTISGIIFDSAERPGTSKILTIISACTGDLRYSWNTQSRRAEKTHGRGG